MCGFAGLITRPTSNQNLIKIASHMVEAISYRGPDDSGVWHDEEIGIALAHKRLAIVDLSSAGHQPMQSTKGRFVIVFNGEIYNHTDIRKELESLNIKQNWRGSSDTETLLAAIENWGLELALQKSVGMFAFSLYDRKEKVLHLVRDRFGEKPLYWGICSSGCEIALLFGSELSSIRRYPGFNNPIDRDSLSQLMSFSYIAAPRSIITGIEKLPVGHLVTIKLPLDPSKPKPCSRAWWKLNDLIEDSCKAIFNSEFEAISNVENALSKSVKDQLEADVSVGCFLSGGIDSSLIAALSQSNISRKLKTFTIGFEEAEFNEATHARAIAKHLGTEHFEETLTSKDAIRLIPNLANIYCEPFADSSQLPTHLVCRSARNSGLNVVLSGDGGDELFGGYNRYIWVPKIWKRLGFIPKGVRDMSSDLIYGVPELLWRYLGKLMSINQLHYKVNKLLVRVKEIDSQNDLYKSLLKENWGGNIISQKGLGQNTIIQNEDYIEKNIPGTLRISQTERMMAMDSIGYLPEDILVKLDRAAMAVSLETRLPFLDHRVARAAWRVPLEMKIRNNQSKWILRKILEKHIPNELINRPKSGFSMPIGSWLRGPLRNWASELLNPDKLSDEGFINPILATKVWEEHLSGRYDHTTKLWNILMWQAWLEQWG